MLGSEGWAASERQFTSLAALFLRRALSSPPDASFDGHVHRFALSGPAGSGKSFLLRRSFAALRREFSDAAATGGAPFDVCAVSMVDAVAHRFSDGSSGLSTLLRPRPKEPGGGGAVPTFFVIDHTELLFPALGGGGGGSSDGDSDGDDDGGNGGGGRGPPSLDAGLTADLLSALHPTRLHPCACVVLVCAAPLPIVAGAVDGSDGGVDRKVLRHGVDAIVNVAFPTAAERERLVARCVRHGAKDASSDDATDDGNADGALGVVARAAAALSGGLPIGDVAAVAAAVAEACGSTMADNDTHNPDDDDDDNASGEWAALADAVRAFRVAAALAAGSAGGDAASAAAVADAARGVLQRETGAIVRAALSSRLHAAPPLGFVDVAATRWADIAGLEAEKAALRRAFVAPQRRRAAYEAAGLRPSVGVLLYGVPGTGKTMLARAMATELSAAFLYLDIPQIVHAEVGESERALDEFFAAAVARAPSVVFLDELQAAFTRRDASDARSDARLTSLLLLKLDGCRRQAFRRPVLFVGATNCPERLDPALLAPGRLDTRLHVPPPPAAARAALVRATVLGRWLGRCGARRRAAAAGGPALAALEAAVVAASDGHTGADVDNALNGLALDALEAADYRRGALVDYFVADSSGGGNQPRSPDAVRADVARVFASCPPSVGPDALRAMQRWAAADAA